MERLCENTEKVYMKCISWEEFVVEVRERLAEKVEDEELVKIQHIPKNNGVVLTGVCIMRKGGKITPTIYLEEFYEKYHEGMALEEITDAIVKKHRSLQSIEEKNLDFFADFKQVKERVVFRLVNLERNKDRLKDMPYVKYLDLAIIFYCHVSMEKECHAAIPIYTRHMKMWNVEKEELWKLARKNTPKLFPCKLISMQEMIGEMMNLDEEEEGSPFDLQSVPMYILTNAYKLNGAAVLLYKHVLADFAKACNGDFYLLPSSIHEVILVPAIGCGCFQEMTEMVREVNESQVEEEELLSDHAYYYSRDMQKLLSTASTQ